MPMGIALPSLGDTSWYDWATEIHDEVDGMESGADVTDAANVSAAGASMITSGAGAPATTPAKIGNIYIDTTADTLYYASGTGSSADWELAGAGGGGTTVEVVTYSAGWPSRPSVDLVIWVADGEIAATTPGAATGDDIVILAAQSATATVTGTTDTLAAADHGTTILYTSASTKTVTLANIATGFECLLVNLGAGALTVAAGGMSYANSFTPNLVIQQGESLYIKQTAASTFIVVGGTS